MHIQCRVKRGVKQSVLCVGLSVSLSVETALKYHPHRKLRVDRPPYNMHMNNLIAMCVHLRAVEVVISAGDKLLHTPTRPPAESLGTRLCYIYYNIMYSSTRTPVPIWFDGITTIIYMCGGYIVFPYLLCISEFSTNHKPPFMSIIVVNLSYSMSHIRTSHVTDRFRHLH